MSFWRVPIFWLVLSHAAAVGIGVGITRLGAAGGVTRSPTHATVARIVPRWVALLAFRFGRAEHAAALLSVPRPVQPHYSAEDALWRRLRLAAVASESGQRASAGAHLKEAALVCASLRDRDCGVEALGDQERALSVLRARGTEPARRR